MKYCRNCGSALGGPGPAPPSVIPAQGPLVAGPFPTPGPGPLSVPPTALSTQHPGTPRAATNQPIAAVTCPRCGTPAPTGFAFCQQCGLPMAQAEPPTVRQVATPRGRPATNQPPVDVQAVTIATDGGRGAFAATVAPVRAGGTSWGSAVLVNRDGSDGQRYPLVGEYLIIGRGGADIAFEEDRFLARQHARIERGGDGGVKVVPIDALNGVFRKSDAPVELSDGMTILVGREVLRFERVEAEETKVHPLVRHGVALFGSPPREPWGRLLQIVPNGGHRDVRHLIAEETVLGREEGDIVFRDDAFMSRRHAALTWDGKRAQLTDLGSSNGTFVRLTGPTSLKHGDHVRMGDQLLRLELGR